MEILFDIVLEVIETLFEEIIEYFTNKITAAKMRKRLSKEPKRS